MNLFPFWETNILFVFVMHRKGQSRNIFSCDNYCRNQRMLPAFTEKLHDHCGPSSSLALYLWEPVCIWSRSWMRLFSSGVCDHHSSPAKPGKLIYVADGWRCWGAKALSGPSWGSEFPSHLSSHSGGRPVSFSKMQIDLSSTVQPSWWFLFRKGLEL